MKNKRLAIDGEKTLQAVSFQYDENAAERIFQRIGIRQPTLTGKKHLQWLFPFGTMKMQQRGLYIDIEPTYTAGRTTFNQHFVHNLRLDTLCHP
jgi:hypothetical protein